VILTAHVLAYQGPIFEGFRIVWWNHLTDLRNFFNKKSTASRRWLA